MILIKDNWNGDWALRVIKGKLRRKSKNRISEFSWDQVTDATPKGSRRIMIA